MIRAPLLRDGVRAAAPWSKWLEKPPGVSRWRPALPWSLGRTPEWARSLLGLGGTKAVALAQREGSRSRYREPPPISTAP